MASTSAQVVDFNSYRIARGKLKNPAPEATTASGVATMIMWVPVWAFIPVAPGQWFNGQ